jgi:hypothetical protein
MGAKDSQTSSAVRRSLVRKATDGDLGCASRGRQLARACLPFPRRRLDCGAPMTPPSSFARKRSTEAIQRPRPPSICFAALAMPEPSGPQRAVRSRVGAGRGGPHEHAVDLELAGKLALEIARQQQVGLEAGGGEIVELGA